jgi:methanogenic corrinoid protein MtbC1
MGGAPVTQDFAEQIGADGFSANASAVPNLAQSLLQVACLNEEL